MRKKIVNVMLLGTLAFATTTSFIGCKDYDDDINRIDSEIGNINKSIDELTSTIGKSGVKSVSYDKTTGKLTIVDGNDQTHECVISQNMPEYTVAVENGKVVLKKDGTTVSSAELPAGATYEEFDPAKLTVNAKGEVLYDGAKTGVTVPQSSISIIEKDGVVVGYKVVDNGKESTFYIGDALPLSSLVFMPEAYLKGVEAMKATTLTYTEWTKNAYTLSADGETWKAPSSADASYINPDMVAYYHVNPVGVTMEQITSLVLTASDKDYVDANTRAFAANNVDLEKCSIDENGILRVVFNGNSEEIQKIDASQITVFNLKATVDANGTSKVVASDYAAIYKSVMKDFVLAKIGEVDTHLYGADGNDAGKAKVAIDADPMLELAYTQNTLEEAIDLEKIVETHYKEYVDKDNATASAEKSIANNKLADYGLKLKFSLSDYYQGENNKTNQSSFAKLEGSKLYAHIEGVTEDPIAAVGRMPLVRVELQDAATGKVVNAGWIKVKITRGEVGAESYVLPTETFDLQCDDKEFVLTYMQMNVNVYQKLGLTKNDFHTIYTLDKDATGNAVLKTGDDGVVSELADNDPNVETNCLKWTITATDAQNAIDNNDGKLTATATYKALNDNSRGDVTIVFSAVVKAPSASFAADSKNPEYWYDGLVKMSNVRMNTVVPGVAPNDCSFSVNIDNVFMGNAPSFKLNSGSADFALDKVGYAYIFSLENEGDEVLGNDGKTYVLHVASETLLQAKVKGTAANEDVVKIVGHNAEYQQTNAAKAILNTYAHSETPFSAIVDMQLTNECGLFLPMTDGQFHADFLRPINVFGKDGNNFIDGTDGGSKIKMLDLVYLTDWRDYKFLANQTSPSGATYDGSGYYTYYGVTAIEIDNEVGITTNMGNGTLGKTLLSTVTDKITIVQANKDKADDTNVLTYSNIGNNVKSFTVRIPVKVTYKWGTVKASVDVTVKGTEGN
nr:hypothetical protein [uncultured Bacteroides sp.]